MNVISPKQKQWNDLLFRYLIHSVIKILFKTVITNWTITPYIILKIIYSNKIHHVPNGACNKTMISKTSLKY